MTINAPGHDHVQMGVMNITEQPLSGDAAGSDPDAGQALFAPERRQAISQQAAVQGRVSVPTHWLSRGEVITGAISFCSFGVIRYLV